MAAINKAGLSQRKSTKELRISKSSVHKAVEIFKKEDIYGSRKKSSKLHKKKPRDGNT